MSIQGENTEKMNGGNPVDLTSNQTQPDVTVTVEVSKERPKPPRKG